MDIMIEKVIMFAVIIAVSFIAAKIGWLNDNVREGLSKLIIKVTAPLMIFSSIAGLEFEASLITQAGTILLLAYAVVFSLILIGKFYADRKSVV